MLISQWELQCLIICRHTFPTLLKKFYFILIAWYLNTVFRNFKNISRCATFLSIFKIQNASSVIISHKV